MRRWLVVAGVWAVAATAIAVLAFLTASDNDEQRIADASASSQGRSAQRRLSREVNKLEARMAKVAPSSQVTAVGRQLRQLGRVASRQDKQLEAVGAQLKAIDERIDSLETAVDQQNTNTTTTP